MNNIIRIKNNMTTQEKITRDDLRGIADGETRQFQLSTAKACYSGRATAYQLQNILGCKFRIISDYDKKTLTITRKDNN